MALMNDPWDGRPYFGVRRDALLLAYDQWRMARTRWGAQTPIAPVTNEHQSAGLDMRLHQLAEFCRGIDDARAGEAVRTFAREVVERIERIRESM